MNMMNRYIINTVLFGAFLFSASKPMAQSTDVSLSLLNQDGSFSVCATSDYYTLQVQNNSSVPFTAPVIRCQLPEGMSVLPNSTQISYPAGSPFQNVGNPSQTGQAAVWDLAALSNYIAQNGIGFSNSDNKLRIRFKLNMDCSYEEEKNISLSTSGMLGTSAVNSFQIISNPIESKDNIWGIEDFDVTYFGGVAGYRVVVQNFGDSLFSGLKLRFYSDEDRSGTYTAADVLRHTENINFGIGPGQPIPLASGLPIDLQYVCHLMVVIEADENCACQDTVFLVDDISRTMAPTQHCSGTLATVGVPATAGHTYLWSPADYLNCDTCAYPIFEYEDNLTNPVTLTYTYVETAGECVLESDIDITIYPAPDFEGYDTTICRGESIQLTVDGMNTFNWDGPNITDPTATVQTVSPQNTSSYTLTVTNSVGCVAWGIITVKVNDVPFAEINKDTISYCKGMADFVLQPFYVNNYSYKWTPSSAVSNAFIANPNVIAETAGNLIMQVSLPNGCSSYDTLYLDVTPSPDLKLSKNEIFNCVNQTVPITVSGGNGYQWFPTTNLNCTNSDCSNVTISTPNDTIVYRVTSTAGNGCSDTAYLKVYPQASQIQTNESLAFCSSELPMMVMGQNITQSIQLCETYTSSDGCDSTHCVDISVFDVSYSEQVYRFCQGDTLFLNGIPYTQSGTDCDTIMTASGCDSVVCVVMETESAPVLEPLYEASIGFGQSMELDQLPDGFKYDWGDMTYLSCSKCQSPNFHATEAVGSYSYFVTVSTASGCSATTEYVVEIETGCSFENLRLPNAFTPNGDNLNDRFGPRKVAGGVEDVRNFRIYNQWGNLVFESLRGDDWDGNVGGKPAPTGVYIWVMHLICPNNKAGDLQNGSVTLIR